MERFWSNSIFKYLRVEPEDHYFLLTEPVNPASSRIPADWLQLTSPRAASQPAGEQREYG